MCILGCEEYNWLECKETRLWTETNETGRLRWKIENEGFNTLKNGGYGMQHKWARKSYRGLKNYYQFMQMGHLINQLMEKSVEFQKNYLQGKNHPTEKGLWDDMISALVWAKVKLKKLKDILQTRRQFILVTLHDWRCLDPKYEANLIEIKEVDSQNNDNFLMTGCPV